MIFLVPLLEKSFWDLLSWAGEWDHAVAGAAVSLQDEPRHPSEASVYGDAAAADTSPSEVPGAGVVLGEKQPPQHLAEKCQAGIPSCSAVYDESLPQHNETPYVELHITNILYLCSTLHLQGSLRALQATYMAYQRSQAIILLISWTSAHSTWHNRKCYWSLLSPDVKCYMRFNRNISQV